jgi:AAA family ATP:ADP antiporter
LYFCCILTAIGVMRPARDAIGMRGGLDAIRWLFIGTALVTLAVNPMFGWLVSRFRRMVFIAVTYFVFAASLFGFYLLIEMAPAAVGDVSGRVFYVWFSVFNLFATMVFWALMADRFSLEQSKRLFGAIAVGGTVGAIVGPWLASVLARPLGAPALLLVSASILCLAVGAAWLVTRLQPEAVGGQATTAAVDRAVIGGSAWQGIRRVVQSRYLSGISLYVLLLTVFATFIYFTRLQMVAALGEDTDLRATVLAQIDLITQVATLVLQLVVTGHVMKRFGVAVALVMLPVVVALGFIGLAIAASFAALVVFDAFFRAIQRAITRPARETLFTVVGREDKYKSKAVTDTFVYRGGDLLGAWTEGWLGALGLGLVGLVAAAVPLAGVWAMLGLWLGRRQGSMLASGATAETPAAPASAMAAPVSVTTARSRATSTRRRILPDGDLGTASMKATAARRL